jgi:hypothetical protein
MRYTAHSKSFNDFVVIGGSFAAARLPRAVLRACLKRFNGIASMVDHSSSSTTVSGTFGTSFQR